jgi:MoxR-like ATPase
MSKKEQTYDTIKGKNIMNGLNKEEKRLERERGYIEAIIAVFAIHLEEILEYTSEIEAKGVILLQKDKEERGQYVSLLCNVDTFLQKLRDAQWHLKNFRVPLSEKVSEYAVEIVEESRNQGE